MQKLWQGLHQLAHLLQQVLGARASVKLAKERCQTGEGPLDVVDMKMSVRGAVLRLIAFCQRTLHHDRPTSAHQSIGQPAPSFHPKDAHLHHHLV